MRNRIEPLATSLIDFGHQAVSGRLSYKMLREGGLEGARAYVSGGQPGSQSGPQVVRDGARSPAERALKRFLSELQREKRRAERSGAPLSLALYRIDDGTNRDARHADRLLEVLHREKRVTDILGHIGDDMVVVLCPDTDGQGIKGFLAKIQSVADEIPLVAVAATYPDDLFDHLANGTRTEESLQPFLAADSSDLHREDGYPLKRALDIAGALFAICLFGPIMAVVAAAVALTSPGPIIFKQTRVGRGGFPFTFYKFRSMTTGADDTIHREFVSNLINGAGADGAGVDHQPATFKMKADPRVTAVGRVIRKTSIDELPQFFNVLKGDMSLVGPRPPIPYEAAQYQPWHLRRVIALKPGITGIWQIEGRSRVPFNEMVRMDLRYIRDCSLALDLKILLKTVGVVIRGVGAD